MNLDQLFSNHLPTGALLLLGLVVLFVVFKTGKFVIKVVLLLVVVGLFAAAYWRYFLS